LRKGSRVLVEGRLAQRWWETPAGQRRSKYEVIAYTVQFIDAASGSAEEELPLKAEE
jgi:single-stranded DNA-binding protein